MFIIQIDPSDRFLTAINMTEKPVFLKDGDTVKSFVIENAIQEITGNFPPGMTSDPNFYIRSARQYLTENVNEARTFTSRNSAMRNSANGPFKTIIREVEVTIKLQDPE